MVKDHPSGRGDSRGRESLSYVLMVVMLQKCQCMCTRNNPKSSQIYHLPTVNAKILFRETAVLNIFYGELLVDNDR